jgi:hypothetical protein
MYRNMYVVLLVVYQKNYKRDVTDIWNQENINVHVYRTKSIQLCRIIIALLETVWAVDA